MTDNVSSLVRASDRPGRNPSQRAKSSRSTAGVLFEFPSLAMHGKNMGSIGSALIRRVICICSLNDPFGPLPNAGFEVDSVFYDSTSFQFCGSEQYKLGIPLTANRPAGTIFSKRQIRRWAGDARRLNSEGRGGPGAGLSRFTAEIGRSSGCGDRGPRFILCVIRRASNSGGKASPGPMLKGKWLSKCGP